MDDFEIIDAHIHLSRSMAEEEKRMVLPGRRTRDRWATAETALPFMDQEGISKAVVLYLIPREFRIDAEKENQSESTQQRHRGVGKIRSQIGEVIRNFNQWGCEVGKQFPRLIPFITIAPNIGDSTDMIEELVLRVNQGAKGVKLHPGGFGFYPADRRMWPVYEKCQELKLPIIADSASSRTFKTLTGWRVRPPDPGIQYGEPDNFTEVLENFPNLTLVLAHLGSDWWDERVELAKKYSNVYFDTSHGFSTSDQIPCHPHRGLAEEDSVRIIRKIGVERVMFGSDGPAHDRLPQLEQILRLPLDDREKQLILSGNAKRILHI